MSEFSSLLLSIAQSINITGDSSSNNSSSSSSGSGGKSKNIHEEKRKSESDDNARSSLSLSTTATTTRRVEMPPWFKSSVTKTPMPYEFDMKATIAHVVKRLTRLGEIVKDGPDIYELESRLVVANPNSHKIDTDIPEPLFKEIYLHYLHNARYYDFHSWYNTTDVYFTDDLRLRKTWGMSRFSALAALSKEGREGMSIEDAIALVKSGSGTGIGDSVKVEWVQKKLIENSDWFIDNRPLSARVSLKKEVKVSPPDPKLPLPVAQRYVTKRTCYFKSKTNTTFFSYSWTSTREDGMQVANPVCSIEVESRADTIKLYKMKGDVIITNLLIGTIELVGTNAPLSLVEMRNTLSSG